MTPREDTDPPDPQLFLPHSACHGSHAAIRTAAAAHGHSRRLRAAAAARTGHGPLRCACCSSAATSSPRHASWRRRPLPGRPPQPHRRLCHARTVMAARCRPSPGPPLVAPSAIRCRRCRCRRLGSTPANNARAARQRACWRHRSATARMAAASRPPRRARRRVPDRQRAAPSPPRPPLLLCCCHRRHLRLVALLPSTRGRSLVRSTQTRAIGQGRRGLESGGAPARSSLTTCSGRPDHARRHARPRVPGASAPPRSMVAKQPTTTS